MLEAYFDASERDSGVFCVAGFAFGADRATKAIRDWHYVWGDTRCHMTDLNSNPQKYYEWDSKKAGQMLEASVPIMNAQASFGVAVSCRVDEIERLAPKRADPQSRKILGGVHSAYPMCTHAVMASLASLVGKSGKGDIAYFFESGDKYQGESQDFISMVGNVPVASRPLYRMHSHTVLDKKSCRFFEMADIFAWEWAKDVERLEKNLPRRPSLASILGEDIVTGQDRLNVQSPTRRGWHLTGEHLERLGGSTGL